MKEPIISVSGLRGIIGESLSPEVAIRYAGAFAAGAPSGPLVIGRDGRASGDMLLGAIRAGLHAIGRDTIDLGVAATPTLGVMVRHQAAAGGIQVTASHNPLPYNGLKLFSAEGRVIPSDPGEQVLKRYREESPRWVPFDELGLVRPEIDPIQPHRDAVLAIIDRERIASKRFQVVLDSNHASGSVLGLPLLEQLGCQVTVLGGIPDGRFAHLPEPVADNLTEVCQRIVQSDADVGFCQDPDADRLAIVDASGRYLGEEYTLAICAEHVLRVRPGTVVANCASSRMTQDIADRHNATYVRTAVGEANVVDAMLVHGAVFGGEGNGGPIDPRVGMIRDSFVGMALVLDAMAARDLPVAALADELPRYAIVKLKIPLPAAGVKAALDTLEIHFHDAKIDRMDGLRMDWPDRWLLVRASNTEPIARAIAEAPTAEEASDLCQRAAAMLGS